MPDFGESLSPREIDVVRAVANGTSNKEIAQLLSISPNTVKVHLRNVFTKLGASSRTEAVKFAAQQGLIEGFTPDETELTQGMGGANVAEAVAIQEEAVAAAAPPIEATQPVAPGMPAEATLPIERAAPVAEAVAVPTPAAEPIPQGVRKLSRWWALLILLVPLAIFGYLNRPIQSAPSEIEASQACDETILADNWLETCAALAPKSGFALISNGLNLYQIGGQSADGVTNQAAIYDTQSRQWQSIAEKPTAVSEVSAAVLQGQIYVPGGKTASGEPTATLEVYSPAQDAWATRRALPAPISGAVTLEQAGLLYVIGGSNGSDFVDDAYVYDPSEDGWKPIASLPTPRAHAVGGIVANELFVVGGYDGNNELDVCERYNPIEDSWSTCPSMLVARGGAAAVVLFDSLYVVGGGMDAAIPYGEQYDAAKDEWQVVNLPMLEGSEGWVYLGAAAVETKLFVLGGERNNVLTDSHYVYETFPYRSFFPSVENDSEQ